MKFSSLCRSIHFAILLLTAAGYVRAQTKTPPATPIDLGALGFPSDFFYDKYCDGGLNHVADLVWLDDQTLVFAFSTNQSCAGPRAATIRLVSLDLAGRKLASADIPYDAATHVAWPPTAVYRGPDDTIVTHCLAPDSKFRLSVLSKNLEIVQQLDLTDTGDSFWGVTGEHRWIILRAPGPNSGDIYTYYAGVPLVPVGTFSSVRAESIGLKVGEMENARVDFDKTGYAAIRVRSAGGASWTYVAPKKGYEPHILAWLADGSLLAESRKASNNGDSQVFILEAGGIRTDLARIPRPYWAEVSLGFSPRNSRVAVGGFHESDACEGLGEIFPIHCRRLLTALVYDQASAKPIFERTVNGMSRGALSPDGRHLAILDRNKLLIYPLP